ncbi:MFS transporter [Legionella worsleiensis]|uniref:Multidrug transporter MdfA n=1 Tax=Legionella worsleiensis TaxID=45076 RepID=A0A0W1AJ88_9GAMM|nr:MFS transporter [Legionella worsleiensis]KTD81447.1 multidrug efflux system protein [Legionella worsleiensis]STY30159.1 multidrug efflux system protein [Legionella worsleiensis]
MSEPLINITRRHALIFAFFLVSYEFLTYLANDMIMPGMILVVRLFNAPESMVATSLTVYVLGGASLQLVLGPISDAYGRRPMMLLGASLFFIFTLWIACSSSMNQFLIARFFQGMGLCFIGVIGYATIQEMFEEMDAVRIIAIMANATVLAPLCGPILGAIVIHYTSWRVIFVMIALCAILVLWGLWRYMPEPIGQTRKDGSHLPRATLTARAVFNNYKDLLTNLQFCTSALATAVIGIPFVTWIALAPIIMIKEAQLSVIQYGLWQLPIFGATILGNWFLHRLTYRLNIKTIIYLGCIIMSAGMMLITLLPYFYGNHYIYLIPGILIYFFSLSVINAPLNRFCLFTTSVSKGTASAIISINVMVIAALGIELGSAFYRTHNNLHFGLYCNGIGLLFLLLIALTFMKKNEMSNKPMDS